MYRKNHKSDELLSNVLLVFAILLMFGFLISWKLVGVNTFDFEMYFYLIAAGLSFLMTVYFLVLYLIAERRDILDVAIDVEHGELVILLGKLRYALDDVRLYSYNTAHHYVRLFVSWRVIGFSLSDLVDQDGQSLDMTTLGELVPNAVKVRSRQLYNYALMASLVAFGLAMFYGFWRAATPGELFGIIIPSPYAFVLFLLLSVAFHALAMWRMNRLYRQLQPQAEDTSEN